MYVLVSSRVRSLALVSDYLSETVETLNLHKFHDGIIIRIILLKALEVNNGVV